MSNGFVTFEDFQLRYENVVPAADQERVAILIEDACGLAEDLLNKSLAGMPSVPRTVVSTICKAARRAYENPDGLQGETIGDYSWRVGTAAEGGLYFTPNEARLMRRAVKRSSIGTIELQGMLPDSIDSDRFLPDANSPGEPILWFDYEDMT